MGTGYESERNSPNVVKGRPRAILSDVEPAWQYLKDDGEFTTDRATAARIPTALSAAIALKLGKDRPSWTFMSEPFVEIKIPPGLAGDIVLSEGLFCNRRATFRSVGLLYAVGESDSDDEAAIGALMLAMSSAEALPVTINRIVLQD